MYAIFSTLKWLFKKIPNRHVVKIKKKNIVMSLVKYRNIEIIIREEGLGGIFVV